ncbi:MAG: hypothetical protein JWP91_2093 [Fibrobacteres bacterium]|nr:hypothetical protein [Fibrobacterota bacterium]
MCTTITTLLNALDWKGIMAKQFIPAAFLSLLFGSAAFAEEPKLDVKASESSVRASVDYGQIVHGFNDETGQDYHNQVLRRSNISINRNLRLDDHIEVKMGFGGVFFYVLPEQDGAPHTRLPKFGVGPVNAEFDYHFGNPDAPWSDLQLGIFWYKYNPDASNLGEYLLRSGTYPGYLVTGGFNLMNSANYQVQGAAYTLNLMENRWKTTLLLPMESQFAPMHSISPTLVTAYKGVPGLELGAGVDFNHLIAARPSKEAPAQHDPTANPDYMRWPTSIITDIQTVKVPDTDPAKPAGSMKDSLVSISRDTTRFYTFQGTKLMGRISLDPKAWIAGLDEIMSPSDLRLFAEVAVLGVKNYPFYYPNIKNRIPVMFGMNLPTFKLIDLLSLQGEYYNALWTNNIDAVFEFQHPVPYHKDYDPVNGPGSVAGQVKSDRFHWSMLAKKELIKGANFYLQVANDHTRTFDYNIKPIKIPITSRLSDYYYVFRIEVGI